MKQPLSPPPHGPNPPPPPTPPSYSRTHLHPWCHHICCPWLHAACMTLCKACSAVRCACKPSSCRPSTSGQAAVRAELYRSMTTRPQALPHQLRLACDKLQIADGGVRSTYHTHPCPLCLDCCSVVNRRLFHLTMLISYGMWHTAKLGQFGAVRHTLSCAVAGAGAYQELQPSSGSEGVWGAGLQGQGGWPQIQVHHSDRHQLGRDWLHHVSSLLHCSVLNWYCASVCKRR